MSHIHSVYDTDPHFSIDPSSRTITNLSNTKTTIVQSDHNSERFTFEMPRHIDGHDMLQCNLVQVHYINIGDSARNMGIYKITDLAVSPTSEDVVICSWLISRKATELAGSLSFVLRFGCTSNGRIDYSWNTLPNKSISVSSGIDNSENASELYSDVIESWYQDIMTASVIGVNDMVEAGTAAKQEVVTAKNQALKDIANKFSDLWNKAFTEEEKMLIISAVCEELKVGFGRKVLIGSYNRTLPDLDPTKTYQLGTTTFRPVKLPEFEVRSYYGPPEGTYDGFSVYYDEGEAYVNSSEGNPIDLWEIVIISFGNDSDGNDSGGNDSGGESTTFTITFVSRDPEMFTNPFEAVGVTLFDSTTDEEKTLSMSDLTSDGDNHIFTSDTSTWTRVRFESTYGGATIGGHGSITDEPTEDESRICEFEITGDITVEYWVR